MGTFVGMLTYLILNVIPLKDEKIFCDIIGTNINCSNGENTKSISKEVMTWGWNTEWLLGFSPLLSYLCL